MQMIKNLLILLRVQNISNAQVVSFGYKKMKVVII